MVEIKKVKTANDNLKAYDYLAKEDDYIVVTEWINGEGYDIDLNGKQLFRLTAGELEAINYLVKTLEYGETVSKN